MSKHREMRQQAKAPLRAFMHRLGMAMRGRRKVGQPISSAWQNNFGRPDYSDKGDWIKRWRRWHRANKKHQANMRRLRRMGCNVKNIPHSLRLNWVP